MAVRLWGDVPLITKPQTATSEDFQPARTPQDAVYKQIVDDLVAAEAAGLPWTDVTGRVNQAAIKTLLSKVYLTMAGFPLAKGATHYKLAADKALEVITYANANPTAIGCSRLWKMCTRKARKTAWSISSSCSTTRWLRVIRWITCTPTSNR
jgi:hypothetical protein